MEIANIIGGLIIIISGLLPILFNKKLIKWNMEFYCKFCTEKNQRIGFIIFGSFLILFGIIILFFG